MTKKQRIDAFAALGAYMFELSTKTTPFFERVATINPWYTVPNIQRQLAALASNLTHDKLEDWIAPYPDISTDKTVALVLAGNIPLVGFHDILSSLMLGFNVQIKPSSDDSGLTRFVLDELIAFDDNFRDKIAFVDRLANYDLIIATGSNNSARYFEYYFGSKPNIIRRNRNSASILHGGETAEQLCLLGDDIFAFFGLGCRSVSKIYVPEGYDFEVFFSAINKFGSIKEHFKYANNYDYNKSIYLINGDTHLDNGFLLVKQDEKLASPLATVHFEHYSSTESLARKIEKQRDEIQCLVTEMQLDVTVPVLGFGKSQTPLLTDYADNVNTLDFLSKNQ